MWLFLPSGFYSVVRHRDRPENLLVRCRERAAADYFATARGRWIPVAVAPEADYPFRCEVPASIWSEFLAEEVDELHAVNFKAAAEARRGHDVYVEALHRVWSVLALAFAGERPPLRKGRGRRIA